MNKRVLPVLIAIILVCSVMPIEALASQTSGSMTVSYTYTFTPDYTINIPASISINDSEVITFTAEKMDIGSDKEVHIKIDGEATYENGGNFYLYKDKGTENESKIPCSILRSNPSGSIGWTKINGLSNEDVAWFRDGDTNVRGYGALKFIPNVPSGSPYGTYIGTVYFKIELIDKS
jgi:hypothetical protein